MDGLDSPGSTTNDRPEPVPDLAWDPARAREFVGAAIELWEEFLRRLPSLPVTHAHRQPDVAAAVARPIPDDPWPDAELFAHVRELLFEWSMYPGHPRFMGYITGSGTVPGAVGDLLASTVNMNLGAWRLSPVATEIELWLTRWFAEEFGLPRGSGGILLSGGAMANFVALKVARDQRAGWDARREGVRAGPPLAVYASEEVHVVSDRALDMLGLGQSALRKIPVGEDFRLIVPLLRQAIDRDREDGVRPIAVVASAGSVTSGSIDPLDEIADICESQGLWFHVDAAYGGPAAFSPTLRPLFSGMDRADSIAFDPHKWLYVPHSAGCVLVRDADHLLESFRVAPSYVHTAPDRTGYGLDLTVAGPQFSRGFQAFKIWLSLLAHGRTAYVRRIEHDVELARYMARCVERRPDFELMAPVTLSICCFRYAPPDLPPGPDRDAYLNRLNERLATEIQLDGRAFCSNAVLDGRFGLRACIVNVRTESVDVEALVDVAAELGRRIDVEMRTS